MSAPLHILSDTHALPTLMKQLLNAGWVVRKGFSVPSHPWDLTRTRIVVSGVVNDADLIPGIVLAAVRGAGVVAVCTQTRFAAELTADLQRIGTVQHNSVSAQRRQSDTLPINDEQRALLERLAEGESIQAAAEAEFISLRTANRRLAAARKELEVRTTREAVMLYVQAKHQ